MSLQKINTRNTVLILMIIATAAMRLVSYKLPVLSNFTPVGAMALFGGVYFTDKWKAYLVPLAALFVSDIFINYLYTSKWVLYYSGSFWMYGCFALMVLVGTFIKKVNVTVWFSFCGSVLIHWLIMDLPWLFTACIRIHWQVTALISGSHLPFEMNMVYGDAILAPSSSAVSNWQKAGTLFYKAKNNWPFNRQIIEYFKGGSVLAEPLFVCNSIPETRSIASLHLKNVGNFIPRRDAILRV
jgi:hypothetical protein